MKKAWPKLGRSNQGVSKKKADQINEKVGHPPGLYAKQETRKHAGSGAAGQQVRTRQHARPSVSRFRLSGKPPQCRPRTNGGLCLYDVSRCRAAATARGALGSKPRMAHARHWLCSLCCGRC